MKCPECGKKLSILETVWTERLFWSCLIVIAMNQSAEFYDWAVDWIWYLRYVK